MIYCVLFEDDERHSGMRAIHMQSHLEFLRRNSAQVRSAGPLLDTADGQPAGGMWLVSAAAPEAAWALVKEDPFWPTGLRKSVRVLEWRQVFSAVDL
jgi:uncharacterized protein YciI